MCSKILAFRCLFFYFLTDFYACFGVFNFSTEFSTYFIEKNASFVEKCRFFLNFTSFKHSFQHFGTAFNTFTVEKCIKLRKTSIEFP